MTPSDPDAYLKRGKFLASTYFQAEFYGRPNDIPNKVQIKNPLYGFSEKEILKRLFPSDWKGMMLDDDCGYEARIALDVLLFRKAKELGYDAIVLIASNGMKYLKKNYKPHSMELNLLHV